MYFVKGSLVANLICFLLLIKCSAFQKTVKITPAAFEYESIAENYFAKGDEKPFPLTVQKGNNLYNSTTLDGRYLFYTTDHSGNYDIWVRDLRSAIIVPVTTHPAPEFKPAISPDGKKLVFVSEENDSSGDIVMINLDPSSLIEDYLSGSENQIPKKFFLTNPDFNDPKKRDSYQDTDPAWAPNGKQIVFASDRFTPGLQNLVLLDISNQNKMISLTKKGAASPQFSFDGKSIVYLSFQDSKTGDIYKLNLDSGVEERLTKDTFLNFSPSLSPDGKFLYFTSIRNDTNENGYLDLGDKSLIVKLELGSNLEKILTTDSASIFDTKYSTFNKGSILYSAALYNTINIYFIPESGPIPKKANIDEQLNFALRIKKTQDNYFLALDSVKLFFETDPLFSIYQAKVNEYKIEFHLEKGQKIEAKEIISEMLSHENDPKNALSYAYAVRRLARQSGKNSDTKLLEFYNSLKAKNAEIQVQASVLKLVGGEKEKAKDFSEAIKFYKLILSSYPDYFERREVKRKLAKLEFSPNSIIISELYFDLLNDDTISLEDLRYILNDLENKISANKNYVQLINYSDQLIAENKLKEKSKRLFELVTFIKSKAQNEGRKFQESNTTLDSFLEPVRKNPECQINPFCEKFRVCVRDPICLKSHLLKSKNFEGMGSVSGSFDELRVFLENYDPELGVELNKTEIEKTFRYYETKARDHETRGNSSPEFRTHLRDAAFHYFFNVENMYLLKEKNIFVEDLYKDYAVYYQRKMVDSIFNYARKQALDDRNKLIGQLNVLGEGKLNVIGRVTNFLATILNNKVTNQLDVLGDFRDLNKSTILGRPGEPDDAIKLLDAHFNLGRPRARPVLYLASLYGYAYYLINKSLAYETYYKSTDTMTPTRKEGILRDLKNAENELKWIIFADPLYADAHQLLGWLYQYIDIFKSTKPTPDSESDGEIYAGVYKKYFSEKHFEENINIYKQILDMLGNIQNKKILSDLNLNLANNYLLLQNFPKAKEHYAKVENYGNNIIEQIQFEDYKQTALFNYNYARSLISIGEYNKAIKYLNKTATIYYENEYYEEIGRNPSGLNQNKKNKDKVVYEVNNKLVLIYSLLGLAERESGNYINAINAYKKALSLNYNSGYVDNINIYSSLAYCYQKVEKYHLSDYYVSKVELEYKKYKNKKGFSIPSVSDWFWNLILPDRVRVIGAGRFPGEFAPEEHYLLAQGVKIQNLSEQGEFEEVEKQIKKREIFLKETGINKLIIGEEIALNAKYKIGYHYFIQGKYLKALNFYDELLDLVIKNKIKVEKPISEKRKILKRKSYTLFRLVESRDSSHEKLLPELLDNLNDLVTEKNSFLKDCVPISDLPKKENEAIKICTDNFNKEWYEYDPLLGLSYFYLGEELNLRGDYDSAFYYYGLAIPLLKDPSGVPVESIGLPGDFFLKTERLRLKINLAIIYERLDDKQQFKTVIAETEELASEFQAVEDLAKIKLLKANFLYSHTKSKSDLLQVLRELNLVEKTMFRSYSTLIDLEDIFFKELYSLSQEVNFKLENWKEIHAKEEKLYNVLLFKHFQNTRVIFEEEKLEGLNQSVRELIRKDLDNSSRYKLLVNTRKPLSNFTHTRIEINSELERVMKVIQKFFPEKKRFFEITESVLPENNISNLKVIRFKLMENSLIISTNNDGKLKFTRISLENNLETSLQRFFSKELENNDSKEIVLIPDKNLANFDFESINIDGKKLSDLKSINYAYSLRQVSPITRNTVSLNSIINTSKVKNDTDKIEKGKFIETKNLKKLGPIVYDSDILNTEIHYSDGNVFSPSVKGYVNLKEFAEKNSGISLSILNNSKLDDTSFFQTMATIDILQSAGIPLILLGGKINPIEIVSHKSTIGRNLKPIGFYSQIFKSPNYSDYESIREKAFKWERSKKYRQALELFIEADTLISPTDKKEKLESELNLARIRSKAIPKNKRFIFYERLIKKYQNSKKDQILIYESLLHECYINYSNNYCRDHFKRFYTSVKSDSSIDEYTKERSKILVNFYIQLNNGSTTNLEKNYQNFLKAVSYSDIFLFHEDMVKLFIKNFILDKAEFHSRQLIKQASDSDEKEIALDIANEIELQSLFTLKSNSIDLSGVTDSIYLDGINKNWSAVDKKIKSLNTRSYDDVLIKYRQRLFTIWKKIHTGSEFNPLQLISETTSTGKSVYSLMSPTDRVLLFNLLLNSIRYQVNTEVNTVFDSFIKLQKDESRKVQNYYMLMAWVEELFNKGDFINAKKYLTKLEPDLGKFSYDYNLRRRFHFAKFKTTAMINNSVNQVEPDSKVILDSELEWYPYYKRANSSETSQFIPLLNEILEEKSNKYYDDFNERELLDFMTYLEMLSFRANSSEVFLDLAFYKDKIEDITRLHKETMVFSDLPRGEAMANLLLKKIPENQEFIAVVNFGLQTFTIKIKNGASNGELAFIDYRNTKNDIFTYHKQVKEKGNGLLLKDFLEPKFRNKILLQKNTLTYLYLSSFYLKTPLELKEDDNFYIVQNPSLILKREIKKTLEYFKGNYSIKKYKSFSEEDRELNKLENLEMKEISGKANPSFISGEKLFLSNNTELQFGNQTLYDLKSSDRTGVWFLSNSDLYNTSFYKDDLNISLNYLDKIHNGPGVFSLSQQATTANILFMKTLFEKKELHTGLRPRFLEAMKAVKGRYPQEINWNGYRLYTNTLLQE